MRLFSRHRIRQRFSNGDSLSLFTEAVEHFQSYHQEPGPEKLEVAAQKLETCRNRYPDDLLPQFYLGLIRVEQSYRGLTEAIQLFQHIRESKDESLRLYATFNLGIANIELYTDEGTAEARRFLDDTIKIAKQTHGPRGRTTALHAETLLAYIDAEALKYGPREESKDKVEKIEAQLESLGTRLPESKNLDTDKCYLLAEYWNTKGLTAAFRAKAAAEEGAEEEKRVRCQEAEKCYFKSLHYKKNWTVPLSNLAVLYARILNDSAKAVKQWKKILQIRPGDEYSHYNLGKIYEEDEPELALENYEKAPHIEGAQKAILRLRSDDQNAHYNLGKIYEKKARQHYEKAPDIPEAQEALGD